MIFAILTLLTALSLAGIAGWFSIIGIMSIYAGAATHALLMGIVLEAGKLVTTSWLYRNWKFSNWKLKIPLILFTNTLMLATSIGVFGFLSKAHLEQGAGTVDNSAKVERLDQQIAREKSIIADDEKVISQLDSTINSYIGKDRTDRSVSVRKSQTPQRNQLRADIDAAQKRIDAFSDEKFKLQAEVRKLQLDVGPIRYIAELIYGTDGNSDRNIELAVRMFTLIIVSTLDPLAVILLIAANHTILRRQNEKIQKEIPATEHIVGSDRPLPTTNQPPGFEISSGVKPAFEADKQIGQSYIVGPPYYHRSHADLDEKVLSTPMEDINPTLDITWPKMPEMPESSTQKSHFIPQKINEEIASEYAFPKTEDAVSNSTRTGTGDEEKASPEIYQETSFKNRQSKESSGITTFPSIQMEKSVSSSPNTQARPRSLSWLTEFKKD
jgi:hypothetical protein